MFASPAHPAIGSALSPASADQRQPAVAGLDLLKRQSELTPRVPNLETGEPGGYFVLPALTPPET